LCLNIGDVFRWANYPDPRYGAEIKARWFICIGKTDIFSQPSFFYTCTTTTQVQHFVKGGSRNGHDHFLFNTKEFPFFTDDCILDYEEPLIPIRQDWLDRCKKDIQCMGCLDENRLRMIYNKLLKSPNSSRKILTDIHNALNNAGITGLKKP